MARTTGFLKGTVGAGDFDNRRDDVIALKRRLHALGLYEPPPEGFGDDIDAGLDRALRAFQEKHGLRVDGYSAPGGETERNVEAARTGRGFDPGPSPGRIVLEGSVGDGGDNRPADVVLVKRALGAAGLYPYDRTRPPSPYVDSKLVAAIAALERDHDLFESGRVDTDDETVEALRRVLGNHRRGRRPGETEVAIGPAALPLLYALAFAARTGAPHLPKATAKAAALLGGATAGQAVVEANKRRRQEYQAIDNPPPDILPFPAEPRDPKDNREEFPAEGPKLPDRETFPIEAPEKPQVFIFPDLSDKLPQLNIFHSDRGNDDTKTGVLELQIEINRQHPDWEHKSGGYKISEETMKEIEKGKILGIHNLEEKKERAILGPGSAFINKEGKRGDGRPGSRLPDLLYKTPDGQLIAFNTVDVDKNGKPTDRELQAAESLRRQGITVYLIAKTHQLKKRRTK